ncbi:hypothetical protein PoB_004412900 [Plakobranchus ocellatus]|uniref:Uncharacterized protein n=1 Tax=Plakobranchus ocellatus TaxID=259542 RepID=A0AAV4BH18_9GAST|nr:hypothetical protein PoB_004412900 [Plakobranchus ocellatus]
MLTSLTYHQRKGGTFQQVPGLQLGQTSIAGFYPGLVSMQTGFPLGQMLMAGFYPWLSDHADWISPRIRC